MEIDAPERDAPGAEPVDVRDPQAAAPGAPPVVAVVVAHDPGDWFEECLRSLAAQEYPSLSVLVIDAASAEPVTGRVAAVLPDAYVRRLDTNPGVAAATNEVLEIVEGAAFYLLCHDDVALEPGAVRALVEEAYRSNAGVVGPKLVSWDDTRRLLQVGVLVDKSGHEIQTVERGELDQEQHDAVRDVFCVPGAATLVRADLFAGLGGYDPAITYLGEDLDLCWRAQVAGARVLVAPQAVARHLEALGLREGFDPDERRKLRLRHRLRSVLTCYGPWHRIRVLPQIYALLVVEIVYAVVAGRRSLAAALVDSWRWNRRHRADLKAARARVAATRAIPDAEVRRLQARGSARLAAFLRGQLGRGGDDRVRSLTRSAGDVAGSLRRGPLRTTVAVWVAIVVVVLAGSRHHLSGTPPFLADLPDLPVRPWPLLAEWLSGWRSAGLGSEAPQPTAYGLLGVAGSVLLGSMAMLRRVLVVAPLLLGPIGAARLATGTGSRRAVLVTAVAYAAIPLPYNALAEGRWGGALVWGAMPWIVGRVARAGRDVPFDTTAAGGPPLPAWRAVLGLGLLTALVAAFEPLAIALPLAVAVALLLGGVATGHANGSARSLGVALGATAAAAVLHLPWLFDFVVPDATWAAVGGVPSSSPAPSVAELLRFEVGPVGASPIGWLPLVVAGLPLLVGRSWRLVWAVRGWTLAVVSWAAAVAAGADAVDVGTGPVELLLAAGACGLALAAGLGMVAFEVDLPGYRFGWRQLASFAAAASLTVATLPVLGAAVDGAWDAPSRGITDVLAFLDGEQEEAPFRTLWVGDASVLPLAGWELDDGVAWALTDDGLPTVADRWSGSPDGTTRLVEDAVELAADGETSRLGRLLAPMGVRYLVVVQATEPVVGPRVPAPAALVDTFAEQLDLAEVEVDQGLRVFRNAAWFPMRADVASPDAVSGAGGYLRAALGADLAGADAVLVDDDGANRFQGDVDGGVVWWSAKRSANWRLDVDGASVRRVDGLGFANAWQVDGSGEATLRYETPLPRLVASGVQAAMWAAAAWLLLQARRRERAERDHLDREPAVAP